MQPVTPQASDRPPAVPLTRREAAARAARRRRRADPAPSPSTDSGPAFQAHVRAARSELENQVAHARAEFEEANERIKERTGRDLILATLIGLAIGAVLIGSLIFVKWLFVVFALAAALLGIFEFSRALDGAGPPRRSRPAAGRGRGLWSLSAYFLELWLLWVARVRRRRGRHRLAPRRADGRAGTAAPTATSSATS